ncbi:hypothetical protein [Bifidobacterium platyrrhinorum]|uniref:Uncharacterized protein n=1 Tax=Bifidobacterium platyrrhinorum TaxID=2661628 RepID=A0A6L9SU16_9BIFI|nr:hypothetical protein [Bifidobacterium platyrrhinorum]NEG55525.1 hypothetical protein [Bifidobacterium platyrrhinorum]
MRGNGNDHWDDALYRAIVRAIDTVRGAVRAVDVRRAARIAAAAACAIVMLGVPAALAAAGWRRGAADIDVAGSAPYRAERRRLELARSDLGESEQDIGLRRKDVAKARESLDGAKAEGERYRAAVEEFQTAGRQTKAPALAVVSIGDMTDDYGYRSIPITVHNTTSNTYTYYSIDYQATDDDGDVAYTGFAMFDSASGAVCMPDSDCTMRILDRHDFTGQTVTPMSWSVSGPGGTADDYGRYGDDVTARRF